MLFGKEQHADNALPILISTITEFVDPTTPIAPVVELKVNASLVTVDTLSETIIAPSTTPLSMSETLYALSGLELTANNAPLDPTTSTESALPSTPFATPGTATTDSVSPATTDIFSMEITVSLTTNP